MNEFINKINSSTSPNKNVVSQCSILKDRI